MGIQLPESEKLNIEDLQRIFDDKSECYKLFWFKAILKKVKDGKQNITYNELICHMMADAYFMVNEYHLNLGPNDSLERIVKIIAEQTKMKPSEKIDKIYEMLLEYRHKDITKLRSNLINDVPYCIQSCFLHDTTLSKISSRKEERIHELNQQRRLLYYYSAYMQYDTEIMLEDDWFKYLSENREILEGWVQYNLIEYLQRRNPTIPGIPNKIMPPKKRNLKQAKVFWKAVISRTEIKDCYTGKILNQEGFESFGKLEIDHFIPWAFIASDEIWNLTPTFKKVNLDKSNNLPDLNVDLKLMAHQHHVAIGLAEENKQIKKLLDSFLNYNLNDTTTRGELYTKNIGEDEYKEGIFRILEPLYMSAQNAGYKKWVNKWGE